MTGGWRALSGVLPRRRKDLDEGPGRRTWDKGTELEKSGGPGDDANVTVDTVTHNQIQLLLLICPACS